MSLRLIAALLCFSAFSAACAAQPEIEAPQQPCASQTRPTDELISRSPLIVLAQALDEQAEGAIDPDKIDLREIQRKANEDGAATDDQTEAAIKMPAQLFAVVDYLKGEGPARVSVALSAADAADKHIDHDDAAFWNDPRVGRATLSDDCRVTVAFEPGARYLLFIGPPHVKAYERIDKDDDKWLQYVRERTAGAQ